MDLTTKDRSIIKQVAFKAAVETLAGVDCDDRLASVKDLAEGFEELLLQMHDEVGIAPLVAATATVTNLFPGSQEVDQNVTHSRPAPAPVAATTSITADSSKDELWQNLISGQPKGRVNEAEWYDNRKDKRNPKGPDFKHKTVKGDKGPVALWLDGQYPAPAFAVEHFQ